MTQARPDDAHARWVQTPRPFAFVRPKLHRDTAEYLRDLLNDEKDAEFETLGELRTKGNAEDHPDIVKTRRNLEFIITLLKDVDRGLIEMVGPLPEDR